MKKRLSDIVKNKKILFITTKNIDYIRNSQEIKLLKELCSEVDLVYSSKKSNILRIPDVWGKLRRSRIRNADIVFCGFEPQFVVPFFYRRFKDKVLIVDFFISVYDTLIHDRKKFKDGELISRFSHRLDRKTIEKASHVITDTKAHAEYFISEFGGEDSKFETLYLEADKSIYFPREQKKSEATEGKFVVLYFGSILPLQGVDVVLDSIRRLKDQTGIMFDIIGPIPDKYDKPVQDNVCYTDWLSQEELAEHIANADLCLAGHFNSSIEKAKRTIPGKAYIYEAMKKRMILGDNPANREIFSEDSGHFFVKMGDSGELSSLIIELMKRYIGKGENN